MGLGYNYKDFLFRAIDFDSRHLPESINSGDITDVPKVHMVVGVYEIGDSEITREIEEKAPRCIEKMLVVRL